MSKVGAFLKRSGACPSGRRWARQFDDLIDAWRSTCHGEYLVWLLYYVGAEAEARRAAGILFDTLIPLQTDHAEFFQSMRSQLESEPMIDMLRHCELLSHGACTPAEAVEYLDDDILAKGAAAIRNQIPYSVVADRISVAEDGTIRVNP